MVTFQSHRSVDKLPFNREFNIIFDYLARFKPRRRIQCTFTCSRAENYQVAEYDISVTIKANFVRRSTHWKVIGTVYGSTSFLVKNSSGPAINAKFTRVNVLVLKRDLVPILFSIIRRVLNHAEAEECSFFYSFAS